MTLVIIAVLVAVMVPANKAFKARSAVTVSGNNLRSLVAANWAFASDNGGFICPAQSRNNLTRWHGARSGAAAAFDPTRGFLAPYLGESRRVNQCPLFQQFLENGQSFEEGTGGYGYNATYLGGTPDGRCLKGALDFARISLGTLADAETTIEELYAWEFNGPFLKDFCRKAPLGEKRDAGAIELK